MCDLDGSDLAEKFKREFNEQFHILVRMHLSFVLDLNTEENEYQSDKSKSKKWSLVPFNNKRNKSKNVMDGAPLTQEGICQIYQLIEYLKKEENLKIEGIFRRTGSLLRQQELRNLLNQGITLELENGQYTVHDCASVLKGFLADLPDPLLTEAYYPAYCQIAELCEPSTNSSNDNSTKLLIALQLLLLLLPNENKILLRDILDLLNLTCSYEMYNRMNADNLAKLFTPHLICPRKLSPEQLHQDSTTLYNIIAYMIKNCSDLFRIPQRLIVDFRARYEKRKLIQQQQQQQQNESIMNDQNAANTVYTFIDQERTAKENEINTTETALAQLYAYIQTLPESSKKRKLIKQFNRENGHGTPLQLLRSGGQQRNKSLGDSIKKHIFHKNLKKSLLTKTTTDDTPGVATPLTSTARARLFCTNCNTSTDQSSNDDSLKTNDNNQEILIDDIIIDDKENTEICDRFLTSSTPSCTTPCAPTQIFHKKHTDFVFCTPDGQNRKSMSPITKSTQRMTRAMQETMMTPRSRKPVLLISHTNINALPKVETGSEMGSLIENEEIHFTNERSLTEQFRDYLESRSIVTLTTTSSPSPAATDSSFLSRTDDFNSNDFNNLSENKLSESLLKCLDGEISQDDDDDDDDNNSDDELVLKPKQFDENGQPVIFETFF